MTTPHRILTELLGCTATTDAIACRVRVPVLAAAAMLERHAEQGLVTMRDADLVTWILTESGKVLAEQLQTPCNP